MKNFAHALCLVSGLLFCQSASAGCDGALTGVDSFSFKAVSGVKVTGNRLQIDGSNAGGRHVFIGAQLMLDICLKMAVTSLVTGKTFEICYDGEKDSIENCSIGNVSNQE